MERRMAALILVVLGVGLAVSFCEQGPSLG